MDHIFTKKIPFRLQSSEHSRDLRVMEALRNYTNLVQDVANDMTSPPEITLIEYVDDGHEFKKKLSDAHLRKYQWEGVSWLTQLRRFGLGGILADEM